MNPTMRMPGRKAHFESIKAPVTKIAAQLLEILGARLSALVVGLSDPKAMGEYAKGARTPQPDTDAKMRVAHQVIVTLLSGNLPRETIQAWFVGMNPDLDDEPPARVILESPKKVLDAAKAFVEEA